VSTGTTIFQAINNLSRFCPIPSASLQDAISQQDYAPNYGRAAENCTQQDAIGLNIVGRGINDVA
jgi:hypothetical protein